MVDSAADCFWFWFSLSLTPTSFQFGALPSTGSFPCVTLSLIHPSQLSLFCVTSVHQHAVCKHLPVISEISWERVAGNQT